jgi:DNA-binding SARP family transcriptional activator
VTGTGLEVGLLGPLRVSVAGRPVELPAGRLPALLAVLALSAGRAVPVERLATAVWGEDLSVDARANVQSNVRRLRRLLGAELVATRGGGYALEVEPDRVDALRFVRLLDLAASAPDPATQRDRLVEALALWRGTPFDGVRSDWLEQTQAPWLQERQLAGLERRIDLDLAGGAPADLAAELGELTGRHPLRESLWVRLLVALERAGRPAEALERYQAIRVRLAEELGTDPGPELQRVHADLLAGRPPAPPGSAPPAQAHQVVPRQLPADSDAFTGREAALKALDGLLGDPEEPAPRPLAIAAIAGTAGIGKTALAVHWAHRVADRFPDGQLYVNLRGFDPSGSPAEPAEAIRGFLDALAVPPRQVPAGLDAQAGLYRSLLAGRRMLVLLDNARDADQVLPLLPGASGCLVLVTSRDRLAGLVATAGAQPLPLDLLDRDEAVRLLARRLGHDRVAAEPDATGELVASCAGLPLALAIVAARAATHPELPLAALAGQLREDRDGLDGFDGGDTATDVRAVFSWSYRRLGAPAARLFRLLGLHPGPDAGAGAAASLAGVPVARARALLAELARAHLVAEHTPGRYALHDLLRAYAAELAHGDGDSDRRAAVHRMLDHYLHTARDADLLLYPHGEPVTPDPPRPGVAPERLSGPDQAMAWFTAERPVLLGVMEQASRAGFHRHTCQLAWALDVFLHRRGHWHDRAATQRAALEAARRLGDRAAQARSHRQLGFADADLGRYHDAQRHLGRALELSEAAGDLAGQAWAHYHRNLVHGQQGRDADALKEARRALELFRAAGDRVGQASALTDVGWYHGRLGNHRQALASCGQALALHQELGNRAYQAHTWSCLGDTHHQLGDRPQATACYRRALELFRELGDRYGEAGILAYLGELHRGAGDPDAARDAWRQARAILDELDRPAADQLRTRLLRFDRPAAAEALFRL